MKDRIDTYVANRVKEKRVALGISQAQLAFELDVSDGFIGMVESPKYPNAYNVKHLNRIAKILGCSPQDFLPAKPL